MTPTAEPAWNGARFLLPAYCSHAPIKPRYVLTAKSLPLMKAKLQLVLCVEALSKCCDNFRLKMLLQALHAEGDGAQRVHGAAAQAQAKRRVRVQVRNRNWSAVRTAQVLSAEYSLAQRHRRGTRTHTLEEQVKCGQGGAVDIRHLSEKLHQARAGQTVLKVPLPHSRRLPLRHSALELGRPATARRPRFHRDTLFFSANVAWCFRVS